MGKKIIENTIFNRVLYKVILIIALMINTVPLLHLYAGAYVKLLLLWGIVLIVWEVAKNPYGLLNTKGMNWLLAFCFSYGITILLNKDGYFSENAKALCYMFLFFVLLYGQDLKKSIEDMKKEMHAVWGTVLVCSFIMSVLCFITFLLSLTYSYKADGATLHMGIYKNRMWGLYNPNVGATINIISLFCTILMLLEKDKRVCVSEEKELEVGRDRKLTQKIVKIMLNVNGILQFACLVLTGSRTAIYAMYIGVAMLVYFLCGVIYKKKIWVKAAAALVSIFVMMVCVGISGKLLWQLPKLFPNVTVNAASFFNFNRKDTTKDSTGGTLNGRQYLWVAGIDQFNDTPFFGITREKVYDEIHKRVSPDTDKKTVKFFRNSLKNGGLHNMYLTILVSSGIVGFCIFCGFMIQYFNRILWYIQRIEVLHENEWFLGMLILSIIILIMEMFENRILYQVNIFYALFWMMMGYAMYFAGQKAKENKQLGN